MSDFVNYLWKNRRILDVVLVDLDALSIICPQLKTIGFEFKPSQIKGERFFEELKCRLGIDFVYISFPLIGEDFGFSFPAEADG